MYEISMFISAGADIKEMESLDFSKVYLGGFLSKWTAISRVWKPIIAAVNGFAVSYMGTSLEKSQVYMFGDMYRTAFSFFFTLFIKTQELHIFMAGDITVCFGMVA